MNRGDDDTRIGGSEAARLHLRVWGDFVITDASGMVLTPRGRKARALLAWLVFHPDRPVSRERLCGLLWGNRAEPQARASLRQALFELKGFTDGQHPCLEISRGHVRLHGACVTMDQPAPGLREPGERLLADLDDIDEGFDDWLRFERARHHGAPLPNAPASMSPPPTTDALAQSIALLERALALARHSSQ